MARKYIYFFSPGRADGHGGMKDLLGGKGAGLAQMSRDGVPVPPGFTISTEVCRYFYAHGRRYPPGFESQFEKALARLQKLAGKRFGDPKRPLLVSVRSGSKFSMPGMMDTILNLGLNDSATETLARATQNPRFAWDAYRRFLQMFGNVVKGIEKGEFEKVLEEAVRRAGARQDANLAAEELQEVVRRYREVYRRHVGEEFPPDSRRQLEAARDAVFGSWNNPRAVTYRRLNKISEELGTACNVQAMVFGNLGEGSATGVGFTRNPATGAKEFYGEYLPNAQGEDVVAGIRTPHPIARMEEEMPGVFRQLRRITARLEKHYRDVQDFEFTVEKGKLYMLQTRVGKRTAAAALRVAVEMVEEGLLSKEEAVLRVPAQQLDQLLKPVFDSGERSRFRVLAQGLPAGPGAASGRAVFSADRAVEEASRGPVILVRPETNPDDIHGMSAAEGILTATGGATSHAAVVGRGMGKVCVVGCGAVEFEPGGSAFRVNGTLIREGDRISLDGFSGEVILGEVPTQPSEILRVIRREMDPKASPLFANYRKLMDWAGELRRLRVVANADVPSDARTARAFGAEGIGLCRTEHMFFGEDRIALMVAMILAEDETERRRALQRLFPLQKEDFLGIFREMAGCPVAIRTLDPPLHEFLPHSLEDAQRRAAQLGVSAERLWAKAQELREANPMLGHRGCRLGITYPEITRMQTRAILTAACELAAEGIPVFPEIMIPLVGEARELAHQKRVVQEAAQEVLGRYSVQVSYRIGTMIEVPRGALTAGEIAREAEFFSFGTNDLTQMTFGFSRDDYGKFIPIYRKEKILSEDPFQSLDEAGVGRLLLWAVKEGRRARRNLKIGICGEHGGDPKTIRFCHQAGLDTVSCSPYRVPVAQLAAAQAAVESKRKPRSQSRAKGMRSKILWLMLLGIFSAGCALPILGRKRKAPVVEKDLYLAEERVVDLTTIRKLSGRREFLFLSYPQYTQYLEGYIRGVTTDYDGNPLEGVVVRAVLEAAASGAGDKDKQKKDVLFETAVFDPGVSDSNGIYRIRFSLPLVEGRIDVRGKLFYNPGWEQQRERLGRAYEPQVQESEFRFFYDQKLGLVAFNDFVRKTIVRPSESPVQSSPLPGAAPPAGGASPKKKPGAQEEKPAEGGEDFFKNFGLE
ncbi:MAG: pyruvate, phosphate dikinase [Elusimicrobia bacterium]|nr:pyruvate, phosphate dikinase [Elusimicrobiota bacterium]